MIYTEWQQLNWSLAVTGRELSMDVFRKFKNLFTRRAIACRSRFELSGGENCAKSTRKSESAVPSRADHGRPVLSDARTSCSCLDTVHRQ